MNVLVLEGGRLFQKVLRDLLLELDCTVDCCNSGGEGLALLRGNNLNNNSEINMSGIASNTEYDLIICAHSIFDQHMQEITKYSDDTKHNVPIILLSSKSR